MELELAAGVGACVKAREAALPCAGEPARLADRRRCTGREERPDCALPAVLLSAGAGKGRACHRLAVVQLEDLRALGAG